MNLSFLDYLRVGVPIAIAAAFGAFLIVKEHKTETWVKLLFSVAIWLLLGAFLSELIGPAAVPTPWSGVDVGWTRGLGRMLMAWHSSLFMDTR